MSHSILAVFIFSLVCSALAEDPSAPLCRDNEVYVLCMNLCPETCLGIMNECSYSICVPGCDCEIGFVKNSYGYCIPPALCPYDRNTENYIYDQFI